MNPHKLMDEHRETELWKTYLNDRRIRYRNALFNFYWPYIKEVVVHRLVTLKMPHLKGEILSYVSERIIASAIPRYNPGRGRPKTFIDLHIYGAIRDGLRHVDNLTRTARQDATIIQDGRRRAAQALGHPPTDAELAQFTGISEQRVIELTSRPGIIPLAFRYHAGGVNVDDEGNFCDYYADSDHQDYAGDFARLTRGVPPAARQMLWMHFIEGKTLRDVANHFDLSESRVCQILKDTKKFLKENRDAAEAFADIKK